MDGGMVSNETELSPRAAADPATGGWLPLERLTICAFIVFVSLLSLEWMSVGGVLGGVLKPFHLGAAFLLAVIALRYRVTSLALPILQRYGAIFIPWVLFLLFAACFARFHQQPYANTKDLVRQTTYSFTGLMVAGYFARFASRARARDWLTWAGLVACVVLSLGMFVSLRGQGAQPVSTVKEALAKSDPDIIGQQLLKTAFESNQDFEEAKVNLRHKVASALLLGLIVSLIFRSHHALRSPLRTAVFWGAIAFGFGCIIFTFSRSITIALAIVLVLNGLRSLVSGRARPAHAIAIAAVLVSTVVMLVSPVGDLIYARFFETTDSYSGRIQAVTAFVDDASSATLFGADLSNILAPPHNAILDAWFSAGVLGGFLVLVVVGAIFAVWLRELRRYVLSLPGWVLPIQQFWVMALGVTPIVRIFSAANGLHMTEWTSIGLFLGCIECNRRHRTTLERAAIETEGDAHDGQRQPTSHTARA